MLLVEEITLVKKEKEKEEDKKKEEISCMKTVQMHFVR